MDKNELFALVEKAIGGDESAFEALYASQSKSILFGAKSWLYDSNDMEDAASEVVLSMYKSIARLKNPYAFKSWMQRIIMTVCVDMNRKNKKEKGLDLSDFEAVLTDNDVTVNPAAQASSSDERGDVTTAIHGLPEAQRRTLLLYYYEDMDYQEIADALKVSASTVSTNLMKARRNLRETLEAKGMAFTDFVDEGKSGSFAAVVTGALAKDVDVSVSSTQVDGFINASQGKLYAYKASASGSSHMAKKFSYTKLVLVAVACSIVIAGGIAAPHFIGGNEPSPDKGTPAATQDTVPTPYAPAVSITFAGDDDSPEHVDPTSAEISGAGTGDKVVGWHIYNEAKQEVESGEGASVGNVFENLSQGNYSINWEIQNEDGIIAHAVREFVVR
jgi:RNA polymerase sigma-70 factor (ECF subfamily)